jgi:hypothetical protein
MLFNEQVRRNRKRFPADFMFQLTAEDTSSLRSQFATLKVGRGQHRKYFLYVFTEHGAIMAAAQVCVIHETHFLRRAAIAGAHDVLHGARVFPCA